MKQPTLFDGERMLLADSLEITAQSLTAYGSKYDHWAVAFSGGKDSSATATAPQRCEAFLRVHGKWVEDWK